MRKLALVDGVSEAEAQQFAAEGKPGTIMRSGATLKGLRPVAWIESTTPLPGGWAWRQSYLNGSVAIIKTAVGIDIGPERIQH